MFRQLSDNLARLSGISFPVASRIVPISAVWVAPIFPAKPARDYFLGIHFKAPLFSREPSPLDAPQLFTIKRNHGPIISIAPITARDAGHPHAKPAPTVKQIAPTPMMLKMADSKLNLPLL